MHANRTALHEFDTQHNIMSGFTFNTWAFSAKERRSVRDRHQPSLGKRDYTVLECPYCDEEVLVLTSSYAAQLPRRVSEHLETCSCYHWSVQPTSRSRKLPSKPTGSESTVYTQLTIGTGFNLVPSTTPTATPASSRITAETSLFSWRAGF